MLKTQEHHIAQSKASDGRVLQDCKCRAISTLVSHVACWKPYPKIEKLSEPCETCLSSDGLGCDSCCRATHNLRALRQFLQKLLGDTWVDGIHAVPKRNESQANRSLSCSLRCLSWGLRGKLPPAHYAQPRLGTKNSGGEMASASLSLSLSLSRSLSSVEAGRSQSSSVRNCTLSQCLELANHSPSTHKPFSPELPTTTPKP